MRRSPSEAIVKALWGWGMQFPPPQAALAGAVGIIPCSVLAVFAGVMKSTFMR